MNRFLDVLVLSFMDNSNTAWRTVKCLRSLGLSVLGLKATVHPFIYPDQLACHPAIVKAASKCHDKIPVSLDVPELEPFIESAQVIHIIGTVGIHANHSDFGNKKVIIQHGGSLYRNGYDTFNEHWNKIAHKTVMQCPDLLGLGAKEEVYIPYAVDTDFIKPVYNNTGELSIGHFPSNHGVKGTDKILDVFNKIAAQLPGKLKKHIHFCTSENETAAYWQLQLKRLALMDVYVEALNPDINGRPYGTWGNAALEAAAMGKIVITHQAYKEIYQREFGDSPLRIANTKRELFDHLVQIIKTPLVDLRAEMMRFREWAVQKHSIEATAARWWKLVYNDLFPDKNGIAKLLAHKSHGRSICEILREIHDVGDETIKAKAKEALLMAKKMNQKLFDYRADWDRRLSS